MLDNLRELTRFRADMVKNHTSLVNQLHETLSTIFPELATIFSQLDSPTCLSLLIAYPGPGYISHAGEARVAETLRIASRGRIGEALAKPLVETAQESVGVIQKQPALALRVSILGERIIALTEATR